MSEDQTDQDRIQSWWLQCMGRPWPIKTDHPTAAEVATMEDARLNELAAQAMGIRLRGWKTLYWRPATDANQALDLAERVFAGRGFGIVRLIDKEQSYTASGSGERYPRFAEALTRWCVAAWIARQG